MTPTPDQVAFALNNRCRHAMATNPEYLGDLRISDCPECLAMNIAQALEIAGSVGIDLTRMRVDPVNWCAAALTALGGACSPPQRKNP